ncbi:hypothetical protein KSP39_PZI017534 [Platanthera zijinensis]|uniref:Uncharacterized protein n=1 Tax=Platanthera zijinensis TaxID=2320716 RepID=A0AAP0G099_9ASPA
MKSKPSIFLKQIFSFVITMVKSKSMAVKSKTRSIKTRLLIFNLLRTKKLLMTAINHKIHALMNLQNEDRDGDLMAKAIVLYNDPAKGDLPATDMEAEAEDEDDYPDLRHSLFDPDEDEELVNGTGSVIDLMRSSRENGGDREFVLEDEIDHAADVFIRRFHRQMWIQKQDSFKRYTEMLARGV